MISMVYGGVLAWREHDLKRMVAYSSMSHMGVVLLGIVTLNVAGMTGAVMQMVAHGLVAGSLFLLIGLLYERTHTRDINDYSSLVQVMPRFALFTVLALVAAVGFPGTAGFIAEIHVLTGGFARWGGWMLMLSVSVLISAAYAFRTISRLFTGPVREDMRHIPDLGRAEFAAVGVLGGGILLVGIFPAPLLGMISSTVKNLAKTFQLTCIPKRTATDIRSRLLELIHHFEHVLPSQGPIRDFVHHNTLHGYQHLPFDQALAASRKLTGAQGYLPETRFRSYFEQGRITRDDLACALDSVEFARSGESLARHRPAAPGRIAALADSRFRAACRAASSNGR